MACMLAVSRLTMEVLSLCFLSLSLLALMLALMLAHSRPYWLPRWLTAALTLWARVTSYNEGMKKSTGC